MKKKMSLKQQAKAFSQGVNKIQKRFPRDIKKQAKEADKLYKKIKKR
jgi:hypothetical protein